ncbi:MAG: hypothetical protein HY858_00350 [Candidatus Solibacter usitatus]|nr:hypothetical protein [Candidatus Solibacter usitatus]
MKRFHFPLDRLRAWRQTQFEREEARLAALLAELEALRQHRGQLRAQEAASLASIHASPVVNVAELQTLEAFRRWVRREEVRIKSEEAGLGARIAEQRGAVVEARRKVEGLDRLKEKRLNAWRAEVDRQTEQAVAELVIARWTSR